MSVKTPQRGCTACYRGLFAVRLMLVFWLVATVSSECPAQEGGGLLRIAGLTTGAYQGSPAAMEGLGTEVQLAKGRFLVATSAMGDPRFSETVILLVEYSRTGAVGLIINRPTEMTLSEVLPDLERPAAFDRAVYFGGPVDVTRLTILLRADDPVPESSHVVEDIFVTGSRRVLDQVLSAEGEGKTFRVYAGYAGWAPQQLEREVARGGWHVVPADRASVFEKDAGKVWSDLMRRISVLWVSAGATHHRAVKSGAAR